MRKRYNIAVVLAGGIGSRVGGNTPKQLLPLSDGRSILEHSIDAFELSSSIDEIALVMHPDFIDEARQLCEHNNWTKLTKMPSSPIWIRTSTMQHSGFMMQQGRL